MSGSLLTPPGRHGGGGLPCSFLSVPLDEAGVDLNVQTLNGDSRAEEPRNAQAGTTRVSGHQPGSLAGRADSELTWKRGEDTTASALSGPSAIYLSPPPSRGPSCQTLQGCTLGSCRSSHRLFSQGQGQG